MKYNLFIAFCLLLSMPMFSYASQDDQQKSENHYQEQLRLMYLPQSDPSDVPELLQTMQMHQFSQMNMVRVLSTIREAKQNNLPTDPLIDKVYEGIAKGVREADVLKAVIRVHNRYEHAYLLANHLLSKPNEANQLGNIIAGSNAAGLTEKDCLLIMEKLQERQQDKTRSRDQIHQLAITSMETARSMAYHGVNSKVISAVLVSALDKSYQVKDMNKVQKTFHQRSQYQSPEHVAMGINREIRQGVKAAYLGTTSSGNGSDYQDNSSSSLGAKERNSSRSDSNNNSSSGNSSGPKSSGSSNSNKGDNGGNVSGGSKGKD